MGTGIDMVYVMSDIHGCYDRYIELLEKINFTESDTLYMLGDVIDRGEESAEILTDMSMRPNVIPVMGNHEYVAVPILKELLVEITEENHASHMTPEFLDYVSLWMGIGGDSTLNSLRRLPHDELNEILDYLGEFRFYEVVNVKGQKYVLTHSGWPGGPKGTAFKETNRFDAFDFATAEALYDAVYFKDAVLVTGHTPTFHIDKKCRGRIWYGKNHIAIDAGGILGGRFACLCLDTGDEFYVDGER